jgi:GNAT superfamily N-acetyltransferase/DNA-binding transcriptional ArsR family regulator
MPASPDPKAARPRATVAEARALAHPLRLRIIRLLFDRELTNRELARALGENPATVLHHVRTLVRTGFVEATPERPGPRGTVEKPYRSTGKSFWTDIDDDDMVESVARAAFDAFVVELRDAEPNRDLHTSRLAVNLTPAGRLALDQRLADVLMEFATDPPHPDGDPCAVFVATHRRAPIAVDGPAPATGVEREPEIALRECASNDPIAALLVRASWAELGARYGEPEPAPAPIREPDRFAPPDGAFFVLRVGADEVACGGLCRSDAEVAEIKGVYVSPIHRGHGYSHVVLQAIEDRVVALGYRGARLETGDAQPEAIALYEHRGYERIACFGEYAQLPRSVCFERRFDATALRPAV